MGTLTSRRSFLLAMGVGSWILFPTIVLWGVLAKGERNIPWSLDGKPKLIRHLAEPGIWQS